VWQTKAETDNCFDTCVRVLIKQVAADVRRGGESISRVGVMFGTHNRESCNLVLKSLEEEDMATALTSKDSPESSAIRLNDGASKRVVVAQLYGTYFSALILK
jgi:proline dehydrogenase